MTSTMTPSSSCCTLSFFSPVSVVQILCVLGLTALGSTRNTGRNMHIQMFCRCRICNDPWTRRLVLHCFELASALAARNVVCVALESLLGITGTSQCVQSGICMLRWQSGEQVAARTVPFIGICRSHPTFNNWKPWFKFKTICFQLLFVFLFSIVVLKRGGRRHLLFVVQLIFVDIFHFEWLNRQLPFGYFGIKNPT